VTAPRYLYLARHGEASEDETALTDRGRAQATALGHRLRDVPLAAITHGPLPRAAETARLAAAQLGGGVPVAAAPEAGDYIPYLPDRTELPAESADAYLAFLAGQPADAAGSALAETAIHRFTGPVAGDRPRHELLVTHNFLIGWVVRHALDAPKWRWLGLNHANAALTVIRYAPGRAPGLLVLNDLRHLGADLAWTGFPADLAV
jgi:probable phosphoglycerate mutase